MLLIVTCLWTFVSWSRLFSRKEIFCFWVMYPPLSSGSICALCQHKQWRSFKIVKNKIIERHFKFCSSKNICIQSRWSRMFSSYSGDVLFALLFSLESWGLGQKACGGCAGCRAHEPAAWGERGNSAVKAVSRVFSGSVAAEGAKWVVTVNNDLQQSLPALWGPALIAHVAHGEIYR